MNERLTTKTHKSFGGSYTDIYIDGELVGHHKTDPILDSFYGGEVWRPRNESKIKISPRWVRLGSSACFLSDVLKAAQDYIDANPLPKEQRLDGCGIPLPTQSEAENDRWTDFLLSGGLNS